MTDTTPESVEALAKAIERQQSRHKHQQYASIIAEPLPDDAAATLRALSARLAEVEAINAKLGEQADKDQAFICNKIIENNELSARADAAEARVEELKAGLMVLARMPQPKDDEAPART